MLHILDVQDRQTRAATNQALFRDVNERVKDLNETFGPLIPLGSWVCECADEACVDHVAMFPAEYETVRQHGAHFLVAPSDPHVVTDVERVAERYERYWVVEMIEMAGEIAKAKDPRHRPLSLQT